MTDTIQEKKNPIVIYHANCLDGLAAAWCFWDIQDIWEITFDFHAANYNELPPDVKDREVYIVDFSYPAPVLKEMLDDCTSMVLLDHHKSAEADLVSISHSKLYKKFDMNKSGARLAWDYLHPEDSDEADRPRFIDYIEDRDLWKFKLKGTKEIIAYINSYERDFFSLDMLASFLSLNWIDAELAGARILKAQELAIRSTIIRTLRYTNVEGYEVPIANIPGIWASDAGHYIIQNAATPVPFSITYYDAPTKRIFSIRSTGAGIDVSEIAKKFGGGGHRNAAGFSLPYDKVFIHFPY